MRPIPNLLTPTSTYPLLNPPLQPVAKTKLIKAHTSYLSRIISLAAHHMMRSKRTRLTIEDIRWAVDMVEGSGRGEMMVGYRCRVGGWDWERLPVRGGVWMRKGTVVRELDNVAKEEWPRVGRLGVCRGGTLIRSEQGQSEQGRSCEAERERLVRLVEVGLRGESVAKLVGFLVTVEDVGGLYPPILKRVVGLMHELVVSAYGRRGARADFSGVRSSSVGWEVESQKNMMLANCLRVLHAMFLNQSPLVAPYTESALPAVLSAMLVPSLAVPAHIREEGARVLAVMRPRMSERMLWRVVRTLVKAMVGARPGEVNGAMLGLAVMGEAVAQEILCPLTIGMGRALGGEVHGEERCMELEWSKWGTLPGQICDVVM